MKSLNLSEWALKHRSLVWYMMLVFMLAGTFSFFRLGREEDPSFTIKEMVVSATWPGATIDDTLQQVTDRIEKKLQETPSLDYLRSYTKPGEATIFVNLLESTRAGDVRGIWGESPKRGGRHHGDPSRRRAGSIFRRRVR
jgi:multidrug efflux pump